MTDTDVTTNGDTTTTKPPPPAAAGNIASVQNNNEFGTNVIVSDHPVLSHKITILRSSATAAGTFRAVLREVTYHLGYEATSNLTTKDVKITVPVIPSKKTKTTTKNNTTNNEKEHLEYEGGRKLDQRVAVIPILRSGLGMVDSMLELIPNSAIHHIGMYKVIGQTPVQYFNRLPRQCHADVAFVVDCVIATSSTTNSVVNILKKWGVPQIHVIAVIASKTGLQQLIQAHPDIHLTVGTVDSTMSEDGQVLPGLGDAGDRIFGTNHDLEDEESLLHPSKRKRSASQSED